MNTNKDASKLCQDYVDKTIQLADLLWELCDLWDDIEDCGINMWELQSGTDIPITGDFNELASAFYEYGHDTAVNMKNEGLI